MLIVLAPLLTAAALCRAAQPPAPAARPPELQEADRLYLRRLEDRNLERSTELLRARVKAQPDDEEALWRLGRNETALGKRKAAKGPKLQAYAEAARDLRRAVELEPGDARARYWLADELAQENSIRRTLGLARAMKAELEKAIELDPKEADARQLLCELLHQLPRLVGGDKQRAVSECEEALRLTPDETSRYPALAQAYLAVDRKADAVAALKRVFSVSSPADPGSAPGDLAQARKLLKDLTGSEPPAAPPEPARTVPAVKPDR